MGSLGKLGTRREQVDLDFDWFGETIRVHPDATDLDVADFMMQAGALDVDDDEQAKQIMGSLAEYLVKQIHPEDRDRFWELAKANRQQMADIMAVSKAITEAVTELATGFPTGQQSDSAPTTSSTSKKSSGGSSSAGRAQRRAQSRADTETGRSDRVTGHAMQMLSGRPDLKLALYNQQRAAEEASA